MPSTSAAYCVDRVRPSHRREHPVARVLQRQMKMRRETGRRRDQIDDLGRAVHRLERADAKQQLRQLTGSSASQQVRPAKTRRRQIAAVRAEMHARERDFLEAGRRDPIDLADARRRLARCAARLASSG